jgi:hypothetical protein
MTEQDDFVLLYQDGLAQLWGRRSRYDDPRSPHCLAAAARRISDVLPVGTVTWPAMPVRGQRVAHQADAAQIPDPIPLEDHEKNPS